MIINREMAMSLWNKSYGKSNKVKDFAGREMVKAAYNDRNSNYGWNLDHILPQSKGGKTTESNLICCHILTNDEKADKFPCFSANGKQFEIVKVENHYEIKEISKKSDKVESKSTDQKDEINFFDSAAGIRFFKSLKGIQNKTIFVGIVVIELENMKSTALIDFINEVFSDKNSSYSNQYSKTIITIKDYNMPNKEDNADMLDRCILLNTYLSRYFMPTGVVSNYQIYYGVHSNDNKLDCLSKNNNYSNIYYYNKCPLIINELVKINTEANQKIGNGNHIGQDELRYKVYEYNYIYTKLAENLKKLIK